ncbi:MAG TPA: hypothetical protein ENK12_11615 [Gammaproteobacteria bacterium]|nr:hypothetical protein [Gammaproteobacteria bacterium]
MILIVALTTTPFRMATAGLHVGHASGNDSQTQGARSDESGHPCHGNSAYDGAEHGSHHVGPGSEALPPRAGHCHCDGACKCQCDDSGITLAIPSSYLLAAVGHFVGETPLLLHSSGIPQPVVTPPPRG